MRNRRETTTRNALLAATGLLCAGTYALCASARTRRLLSRLRGKVVLITGSSRGLGLALAEEFGKKGAKLALCARDTEELGRARKLLLVRGAAENDEDIFVSSHDLCEPQQAEQLIEEVTARFGHIDVLVNNAGVITVGPVENQTAED